MMTLRTAQVCVIDDEPEEYCHLIAALNSLGLGCVHVAGDKQEELPEKPFRGLRLVFLDMQLGTLGGADPRVITAHTAHVFSQVVSPESAPVVVIVWTKHRDYLTSFRESLFEAHPGYRGLFFFILLEKPHDPSALNAEQLKQAIDGELAKLQPLPLLWGWDALVQQAAWGVTAEICRLAVERAQLAVNEDETTESNKMLDAIRALLRVLIRTQEGKSDTPEGASQALLNVLAPVHFDRLENLPAKPELADAGDLMQQTVQPSSLDEAVALNSMLLIGAPRTDGQLFRPGTICKIIDADAFKVAFRLSLIDMARHICSNAVSANDERLGEWLAASQPVLLEISPACDYAQKKRPLMRFVAGFLVPLGQYEKQMKQSKDDGEGALRRLRSVRIRDLDADKIWLPIFVSWFVFTSPETTATPFLTPVGRLKDPALTDLRNWLSAQSARVGYLSVDPSPAS